MIALRPSFLKRYKDLAWLLSKYGGVEAVHQSGLSDAVGNMAHVPSDTRAIASRHSLRSEMALFMIASALDWLMTVFLLKTHSSDGEIEFVESNPVAGFFLDDWGFTGLFGFKVAMVLVIAACCAVIAVRRVHVARLVLRFGVVSICLVIVYSAALALRNT